MGLMGRKYDKEIGNLRRVEVFEWGKLGDVEDRVEFVVEFRMFRFLLF